MKDKIIYLDNASTTPLDGRVLEKMTPYLTEIYGNANSLHNVGRVAVKGLDEAREIIADIIRADFNEVYFTSGGTESDNWALRGAFSNRKNKNKIVLSSIEHSAMLKTCEDLELQGASIVKVNPNVNGIVDINKYNKAIDSDTFMACLMYANNEIGTIQNVKGLAEICKAKNCLSFTDAVQAIGAYDINVKDLGVDLLSFSAHKFGGPKGVGCLYIKNGTNLGSIVTGGHQERSKRGGTSNVAGAIGMAYALKYNRENLEKNNEYIKGLREYFIDRVLSEISVATLNGDRDLRLPNNANITFNGVDGEALLYKLDLSGICVSLGAACSAGSVSPSHVLKSIGLSDTDAKSSIRFTFGLSNTKDDVDFVVETLKKLCK